MLNIMKSSYTRYITFSRKPRFILSNLDSFQGTCKANIRSS